jgi:hypothetical protein
MARWNLRPFGNGIRSGSTKVIFTCDTINSMRTPRALPIPCELRVRSELNCVVVAVRIRELSIGPIRNEKGEENHGGKEQPTDHSGNTILAMRTISSSSEKTVRRRGVRGAAAARANRETSCSPKGTTRISRTMS